jgi:hypothetical protein
VHHRKLFVAHACLVRHRSLKILWASRYAPQKKISGVTFVVHGICITETKKKALQMKVFLVV